MNAEILKLNGLTVQRGDFPLCEAVHLSLQQGDICHLIGANGTGKTTLMMQVAGLLPVITGDVAYSPVSLVGLSEQTNQTSQSQTADNSVVAAPPPVYVSHQLGIHPSLTVAQNLRFLLNLYGIEPNQTDIDTALSWVGLQGFDTVSSSHLSAGQTRRVTLARLALMQPNHTPLWLLDEPFTALDVAMVAQMEARVLDFVQQGGAVLMTSHQPVQVATKTLDLSQFLP